MAKASAESVQRKTNFLMNFPAPGSKSSPARPDGATDAATRLNEKASFLLNMTRSPAKEDGASPGQTPPLRSSPVQMSPGQSPAAPNSGGTPSSKAKSVRRSSMDDSAAMSVSKKKAGKKVSKRVPIGAASASNLKAGLEPRAIVAAPTPQSVGFRLADVKPKGTKPSRTESLQARVKAKKRAKSVKSRRRVAASSRPLTAGAGSAAAGTGTPKSVRKKIVSKVKGKIGKSTTLSDDMLEAHKPAAKPRASRRASAVAVTEEADDVVGVGPAGAIVDVLEDDADFADFANAREMMSVVKKARNRQSSFLDPAMTPRVDADEDDEKENMPPSRSLSSLQSRLDVRGASGALPTHLPLPTLDPGDPLYDGKRGAHEFFKAAYTNTPQSVKTVDYADYLMFTESTKYPPLDPPMFEQQLSLLNNSLGESFKSPAQGAAGAEAKDEADTIHVEADETEERASRLRSDSEVRFTRLFKHAQKLTEQGSYEEAARCFQLLASAGHTEAQYRIASFYDQGLGCERDLVMAVKYYMLAAVQNNSDAQVAIGACHYNGQGVPLDIEKALYWFQKAANNGTGPGNAEAMYLLAGCYALGEGSLTKDWSKAIEYYRRAARLGHAEAMCSLARCIIEGKTHIAAKAAQSDDEEIDRKDRDSSDSLDSSIGMMVITEEEEEDNAHGSDSDEEEVGDGLMPSSMLMKVSEEEQREAFVLYRDCAAKHDHAVAHCYAGVCYEKGIGVQESAINAARHYAAAAKQNHPRGLSLLANLYWKGRGVEEDAPKAQRLFERAAILGDEMGQKQIVAITGQLLQSLAPTLEQRSRLHVVMDDASVKQFAKMRAASVADNGVLQARRKELFHDIIQSESVYTYQLGLLCEKYIGPMYREELVDDASRPAVAMAYRSLQRMLHMHLGIVAQLRKRPDSMEIVNVYNGSLSEARAYIPYARQYTPLVRRVGGVVSTKMRSFLSKQCKRYGHTSIAQLLILPLQRISRYAVFLHELLENMPGAYKSQRASMVKLLLKMRELAQEIQDSKHHSKDAYLASLT